MNRIPALLTLLLSLAFIAPAMRPGYVTAYLPDDLADGKKLYNNQCALCHGIEGTGGRGPALNRPRLPRAASEEELVKVIAEGIQGSEMPGFWQMTPKEVGLVARYVRSLGRVAVGAISGDAARGKTLYETKGNCAACHIVGGQGGIAGPELTEIGARRSAAYLREALLTPAATLPDGFLVVSLTTADGRQVRGVRVNEDSFSIQLRDARQQFHSFRKAALKELKKEFGVSPMPAYRDKFTPAELDDLIAWLASLRGEK